MKSIDSYQPPLRYQPDSDSKQDIEFGRAPNYTLRRVGAGLALLGAVAGGAKLGSEVVEAMSQDAMTKFSCEVTGETTKIAFGETTWNKVASPLARELGTSVDNAMIILKEANPGTDLGNIRSGTEVNLVECGLDN